MKKLIGSSIVMFLLLVTVAAAFGTVPTVNVSVADSSGKPAFKGSTSTAGAFTTPKLQPGAYVVLLTSKDSALKGNYSVVVGAGKKKVMANTVPAEKFAGGGVALKVDVGPGLNISGQIASENNVVTKNGKKMVWIPQEPGSHIPGHWVEEGSPEAKAASRLNAHAMSSEETRRMLDKNNEPHQEFFKPGR